MEEVKTQLKTLEDRTKKGFMKVKDDFAKLKEDLPQAAEPATAAATSSDDKTNDEVAALSQKFEAFQTEAKTALEEM